MKWPGMKSARFLNERQLLTVSQAGIVLWTNRHPAEGWELAQVRTLDPLATPYTDVRLNHDRSRFVATREGSGGGDVFEVASGRLDIKLRGQNSFGNASFSPDGQWIASGYFDNSGQRSSSLWIWSATNGSPVRQIPMANCAAHFSPDGRWLVVAARGSYLQYAVQGHPTNWTMTRSFPHAITGIVQGPAAFFGDGDLVALLADATVVRLLEAATGRQLARFTPPPDVTTVERLHFSPDTRWLVADTDVGSFLWDLPLIRARLRGMNLDWE
jgi:WD40 repeat protein